MSGEPANPPRTPPRASSEDRASPPEPPVLPPDSAVDWAELARQLEQRGCRLGATYDRVVAASLVRVWENVFDWEHLPWLHAQSFSDIELLDRGPWGWKARARLRSEEPRWATIELRADRPRRRYVSATLEGAGSGTEIWTRLEPLEPDRTAVHVEFWLPTQDAARAERVGRGLVDVYTVLWDQDEAMMRERTRVLAARRAGPGAGVRGAESSHAQSTHGESTRAESDRPESNDAESNGEEWRGAERPAREERLDLGPVERVRARLPLDFELGSEPHRLVLHEGRWRAISLRCPHMGGPLDAESARRDRLRCPWHGYAFDLASGRECEGRPFHLAEARVELDPANGHVYVSPRALIGDAGADSEGGES